jgi:S-adenosylmethionine:tRNA ribosyltransferase-isomerase
MEYMKTSDFNFELPKDLIAQYPPRERGQSRLMVIDKKNHCFRNRMVKDLPLILPGGALMVFNDSRVRKGRLFGVSEETGAKVEFLLLETVREKGFDEKGETGRIWKVMVQRAGRRRPGSRFLFEGNAGAEIIGDIAKTSSAEISADVSEEYRLLKFDHPINDAWLDVHGHVPLPPYIKREDSISDSERYQTIYAMEYGSSAAPTAGLHFTKRLLGELEKAGIETVFITLHVGLGTFLPVRAENLKGHKMHSEEFSISDEAALRIEKARAEGRMILAVGTTSLRALESAWVDTGCGKSGMIKRGEGSTSIFIYPGYIFRVVDALFTNFHTPQSTLLMLVSAFAGREFILSCYMEAIKEGYHFFSYGDACLIM